MTLSGINKANSHKLIIERAHNISVLSSFYCGNTTVDTFIHNELQDYLDMGNCKLFVVKDNDEVIGMFCLETSNLTLSESAKKKMLDGKKPSPKEAPKSHDDCYWLKVVYEATEITYFAIRKDRQNEYIGSSIIESIMQKVSQNKDFKGEYVIVRALNENNYSAIPFYKICGFTPATNEVPNQNLFMYRVVRR